MKAEETMRLIGSLRVRAYNAMGAIVHDETVDNLVTLAGRNLVRDLLRGASAESITHLAVGTGATAAAAGDEALEAEVHRMAVTEVTVGDGEMMVATYLPTGSANGNSLSEAGLLTADAAGTLYARTVHSAIAKSDGVAINYEWTFTFGAA